MNHYLNPNLNLKDRVDSMIDAPVASLAISLRCILDRRKGQGRPPFKKILADKSNE